VTLVVEVFELILNDRASDPLAALADEQVSPAVDPEITWWRAVMLANAGKEDAAGTWRGRRWLKRQDSRPRADALAKRD
jgi:hypothetical protein